MTDNIAITMIGVSQLLKSIDHLTKSEWTLLVKRSVNAAMKPVLKIAKSNAKANAKDTGLMWKSLKIKNARYHRKRNNISGKISPENVWHAAGFSPKSLGKKGGKRFNKRAHGRKTGSENPAKYAHFSELGTSRGVTAMRWMRSAAAQGRQPAAQAFVAKGKALLPKAVKAARKHGGFATR